VGSPFRNGSNKVFLTGCGKKGGKTSFRLKAEVPCTSRAQFYRISVENLEHDAGIRKSERGPGREILYDEGSGEGVGRALCCRHLFLHFLENPLFKLDFQCTPIESVNIRQFSFLPF
jgi:hypothetical protein